MEKFLEEFKKRTGIEFPYSPSELDEFMEIDGHYKSKPNWCMSSTIYKVNELQEEIELSGNNDDNSLFFTLSFESGINNGTQLNDWDISNEEIDMSTTKVIQVIDGIVEDIKKREFTLKWNVEHPKNKIPYKDFDKKYILELIRNMNYDSYVTGGSANNRQYRDALEPYCYIVSHKEVEVER